MSELVERRHFPRAPLKFPVLYRRKTPAPIKVGVGWAHNLCEEGACLELTDRLEPPAVLRLLFQTDSDNGLNLTAVVMWAAVIREKGDGILHGVTFPDLHAEQRAALREFLQHEEGARPAAAPGPAKG
jgi:hypothetical protein